MSCKQTAAFLTAMACSLASCVLGAEPLAPPNKAATVTPQDKRELEEFFEPRGSEEKQEVLNGIGWTMIHCSSEAGRARCEKVFTAMEEFGKGNEAPLAQLGGAKGVRKAFRDLLGDPDPVIRGFVAVVMGANGDPESKPALVAMLTAPNTKCEGVGERLFGYHRGRAAMGLGLMGAKEHAKDIAALLTSKDEFDRWGAALGLGYLKARDYAPQVAKLLADEQDGPQTAAMRALAAMQAREYAKDIAKLLASRGDPSISETAFWALGELGAKEHAPDIAKFLGVEFRREHAATALGVLGAREYAADIAKLLDSKDALDRRAALMALGMLKAKEHEKAVAQQLTQAKNEEFVGGAAAAALLLIDSKEYAREAAAMFLKNVEYSNTFRPISRAEVLQLKEKAEGILKERP